MIFTHPKVIKYIVTNYKKDNVSPLTVATIRRYMYNEGQRIHVRIGNIGEGDAIVRKIVSLRDAIDYVKYSGFDTVNEWIDEAMRLHKRKSRLHIVVIDIIKLKVKWYAIY